MPRNALYTALIRAKSASGLFVVGNLKLANKLSEKDPVHLELKRLREHCSIMWSIPLTSPDIYVHNVRPLNKHCADLTVNPLILQSQVLILQETMTLFTDNFNIPGHSLIGRIDGSARTPGSGTHIYSRNPNLCKFIFTHSFCHDNAMIEILVIEFYDPVNESVILLSIYRSPRSPFRQFLVELELVMCKINSSSQLIITGDFNIDFFARSPERNLIMKYFSDKGMMLAISGVSTNYGSQLDCVFTKNVVCSCSYYESYFSDHKPMLITLDTGLNAISTVDNHDILPHYSHSTSMTGQQSYLDDIADVAQIPTDNISKVDPDVIISQVYIPTPIVPPISTCNNPNTFTYAMRQSLAQCINLQRIPIRPTDFTGCRVSSTAYYDFMHANVRDRFNKFL